MSGQHHPCEEAAMFAHRFIRNQSQETARLHGRDARSGGTLPYKTGMRLMEALTFLTRPSLRYAHKARPANFYFSAHGFVPIAAPSLAQGQNPPPSRG